MREQAPLRLLLPDELVGRGGRVGAADRKPEADEPLRELLGREFCEYYATSRAWELKAWRQAVSDWERERYVRAV